MQLFLRYATVLNACRKQHLEISKRASWRLTRNCRGTIEAFLSSQCNSEKCWASQAQGIYCSPELGRLKLQHIWLVKFWPRWVGSSSSMTKAKSTGEIFLAPFPSLPVWYYINRRDRRAGYFLHPSQLFSLILIFPKQPWTCSVPRGHLGFFFHVLIFFCLYGKSLGFCWNSCIISRWPCFNALLTGP